jgi:uncharacterized paraquat-inducible protein A
MGMIKCPCCQEEEFTWIYDDEVIPTTTWACGNCRYIAYEDESYERVCVTCGIKNEMRLEDETKIYWYCHRCKKNTLISEREIL